MSPISHPFLVMKHPFAMTLVLATCCGLVAWVNFCAAQTISIPSATTNQPAQNPQAGQVQPPQQILGVPANVLTPQTTSGLSSISPLPSPGLSLGSVGRGLPGMPGGPPINTPVGARDPSSTYMRPPVVGPLFCDPSINITC